MNAVLGRPSNDSLRTNGRSVKPIDAAAAAFRALDISPHDPQSVPVDLDAVARHYGLTVYKATFGDPNISGMLILDSTRVPSGAAPGMNGTIFLKHGEYPLRSRFTLAHEIGHLVLGHRNGGVITDFYRGRADGYVDPQERDANEFAAELLMPAGLFKNLWESAATEEELSIVFGVSVTAAAVRAQRLGLRTRYEY